MIWLTRSKPIDWALYQENAYFTILCQVDLQSFCIVFETQRGHGEENVLAIDRLPLFLVAFLRSCNRTFSMATAGPNTSVDETDLRL